MKFLFLKRVVLWPLRRWFPPEDRSGQPPPCAPEVWKKGTIVGAWVHPSGVGIWVVEDEVRAVNRQIKRAAKRGAHGRACLDWSYAGGHVVVRAIGNRVAINRARHALEARWGGGYFGGIEDPPTCDTSCGKRWMPGSCDPDCPNAPAGATDGLDGVLF